MRIRHYAWMLALTIVACDREQPLESPLVRGAPIDAPPAGKSYSSDPSASNRVAERNGNGSPAMRRRGESGNVDSRFSRGPMNSDAAPAAESSNSDVGGEKIETLQIDADGYAAITLTMLADFEYVQPEPNEIKPRPPEGEIWDCKNQIPPHIRALDRRKVVVRGFMVPIEIEEGRVKSFVLSTNLLFCCFGITPWLNEWISVRMPEDETAQYVNDLLVTVYGTFSVGEDIDEGWVLSLFRMTADRVSYASGI